MKVSLQLYSIKDETAKDFFGSLEKVAKMGYTGVEFAGFGGIEATDMKAKLDELGLNAVSAHVGINQLTGDSLLETIEYLKVLGATYIICPFSALKTVEFALDFAKELTEIGKICKENGLLLGYHNHDFELIPDGGQYPLEVLFENVDPEYVIQEPDLFWVEYAGLDAIEYLEKNKARCPIIHIKQIQGKDNVNAGDGTIDIAKVYSMCPDAIYVYEQEEYPNGTPLECVEESMKYMSKI